MKKLILVVSMILLLVCLLSFGVSAASGSESSEYGEITIIKGISEPSVLDKDARVVILAKDGTYYTFPSYYVLEDQELFRWKLNSEVLSILGYSTSRANDAFRPYIIRMEIPEGITKINPDSEGGAYAFEDARIMIEATIPQSVTIIGNYAFNRAYKLETLNGFLEYLKKAPRLGELMLGSTSWGKGIDLVIPEQITVITGECFKGSKINSVTFHSGVTEIGSRAFQDCVNITSVKLPQDLVYLRNHAFAACTSLTSIDVTDCVNLLSIGEFCFEKTKISSFDFSPYAEKMTSIGIGLFNECKSLSTVIGYENVDCATVVGEKMFKDCPITEIKFPSNITAIHQYAFNATRLQGHIEVPNAVTSLGQYAFASSPITSISLPSQLETLANHVFANCTSLTYVDTSKATSLKTIDKYCFEKSTKLASFDFTPFAISFVGFVGEGGAFNSCTGLKTITGLEKLNITNIPTKTFYLCPITEIKLPESLVTIGNYAFQGHNSQQTEFRIPNLVESIGNHAFARGTKGGAEIVKIYLSYSLTSISENYNFENWYFTEMYIPASLAKIPTGLVNNSLLTGVVYYYTGAKNGIEITQNGNTAMTGAEWISAEKFTGASSEKNYIVYGYNPCKAFFNDIHTEDNNPCMIINCTRCGLNGVKEVNPVHNEKVTASYISYYLAGKKITSCSNEGCDHHIEEELPSMFTCYGYSVSEASGGIIVNFSVNNKAIDKYSELTNKTVSYGLFAVKKDTLGDYDVLDEKGDLTVKGAKTDLTSKRFDMIEFKIIGIKSDVHKATKIAMGAYVIESENGVNKITYLQEEETNGNKNYQFVCYNDYVG